MPVNTDHIDKSLGDAITKISDLTPQVLEQLKTAYTAYLMADASVSIYAWPLIGFLFLIMAFAIFARSDELWGFSVVPFAIFILCVNLTFNSYVTKLAPEAKAVTVIFDKVLEANKK